MCGCMCVLVQCQSMWKWRVLIVSRGEMKKETRGKKKRNGVWERAQQFAAADGHFENESPGEKKPPFIRIPWYNSFICFIQQTPIINACMQRTVAHWASVPNCSNTPIDPLIIQSLQYSRGGWVKRHRSMSEQYLVYIHKEGAGEGRP